MIQFPFKVSFNIKSLNNLPKNPPTHNLCDKTPKKHEKDPNVIPNSPNKKNIQH